MSNTISFTKKDVKNYLDECIIYWRKVRANHLRMTKERDMANCYIDAFQSVRSSLFGELLKK